MLKNKALIVGIDDYSQAPLGGCVNDAEEIAKLLETNEDGSPNFSVKLKLNIQTKAELLKNLHSLFKEGESDIALFYFSGHGTDEMAGQIVTPDFNGYDMGISMNDILQIANASKSRNKIIILDCCYSGKLGDFSDNSPNANIGKGVTILTASNRDEVAIEDGITGHGVFTELLIQGLKGGAADVGGNITPASLYSFVDQSLGAWEQRPLFKTNITGFLPIRPVEANVSNKLLRKLHQYFAEATSEFQLDPSFEFTNTPEVTHEYKEPFAKEENVGKFKELQLYESVGLIEPVGEEHMYFAAMNSKSCRLTPLGLHYWKLSRDKRF